MTKKLEFQGSLYRTKSALCEAVARAWFLGDSPKSTDDMEADAAACIAHWGLESTESGESWLESNGLEFADIVVAFEKFQEDLTAKDGARR